MGYSVPNQFGTPFQMMKNIYTVNLNYLNYDSDLQMNLPEYSTSYTLHYNPDYRIVHLRREPLLFRCPNNSRLLD